MKTKIYVVILLCVTTITSIFAQERAVVSGIRQAKESKMIFKKMPSVFAVENEKKDFSLDFINTEEVYTLSYNPVIFEDETNARLFIFWNWRL